LGEWLASVPYRYWPTIEPELMYHAARLGLYEGLRSGMTTCADHHYLYHAASTPELEDAVWQAASEMGMRFVLCRGGANVMGSHKGLADAGIQPETIDQTLVRLSNSYDQYHHAANDSMRKLVVAPTSLIHSTTAEQLRTLADFARSRNLRMHSHLLEVSFDDQQAQALHGMSAVQYAEQCEWLGDDVWFAHLVKATKNDINLLAKTGTGIAHCPTSNLRLGSGIAPVIEMQSAGMPISIGVDGSASSESASMLQELNLSWLIHRATHGAEATNLEQVIQWGTQGGAQILGYDELGTIAAGQLADIVLFKLDNPRYCSVHHSTWAPVMLGEPADVEYSFINGNLVVDQGRVKGLDEQTLVQNVIRETQKWRDEV
jgi:cytosine/adenosine deaminase-related metal-dependent hydrolase